MRSIPHSSSPRTDAGEITDKGYINRRAVLHLRKRDMEALYAGDPRVVRP